MWPIYTMWGMAALAAVRIATWPLSDRRRDRRRNP